MMRKLTSIDRLETLLMDCSPEEFLTLMERIETIKRLRMIQVKAGEKRKPKEETPQPMFCGSTGGEVMSDINYNLLPEHIRRGMRLYLEQGLRPGHFLVVVLEDSLTKAFREADAINAARMLDIASFLCNEAPLDRWGTHEKVEAWISTNERARELVRPLQTGERS